MKKEGHPQYAVATATCACGKVMQLNSTAKDIHCNTCSACHPYYTGKATFVDVAGRVDQFNKRYKKEAAK
jgi:large subunit ribosomal protein L31